MKINSLVQLKDYCLRRLGAPTIVINVAEDQIWDRLQDAIDFFNEFHYDSTARILHKYQITAEDIENRFIPIPTIITHVHRILPLSDQGMTSSAIFDPVYQMRLTDFLSFNHLGTSLQYWNQWQSHLRMLQLQLSGAQQEIDFTRYEHELRIHVDWRSDIRLDQWIIIDAERLLLDPDSDINSPADVYDNIFLKEYATALIKQQWGENLSKYGGIQLPGGITYSGERILSEAREDIQRIKEEARSVYEMPLGIYLG